MEMFGAMKPEYSQILSKDALEFVAKLARKYTDRCGGFGRTSPGVWWLGVQLEAVVGVFRIRLLLGR